MLYVKDSVKLYHSGLCPEPRGLSLLFASEAALLCGTEGN
jgi:hypothetical protein